MYYKIKVKIPFKAIFENVFTSSKETRVFISGEEIEGRIDKIGGKNYLTTSEGDGAIINTNFVERVD